MELTVLDVGQGDSLFLATPDGQSLMTLAYLNDVMTVQQLIDVVAFLQSSYHLVPPPVSPYSYVYP